MSVLDEMIDAAKADLDAKRFEVVKAEFYLNGLESARKAVAAIPGPKVSAPPPERAHRRNIPDIVLDAIKAKIAVEPLPESDAVEYLFTATSVRRAAIEKAITKLLKQDKLFVVGEHYSDVPDEPFGLAQDRRVHVS